MRRLNTEFSEDYSLLLKQAKTIQALYNSKVCQIENYKRKDREYRLDTESKLSRQLSAERDTNDKLTVLLEQAEEEIETLTSVLNHVYLKEGSDGTNS